MKRQGGDLFDRIVSKENLLLAHKNARKGKTTYKQVQWVDANLEQVLNELQQMLIKGTFTTSKYVVEEGMKGGKIRKIHKLPYYPDRIVQHAIIQQCGDIWVKSMIRDTFQSIKGRGTKDCIKRVRRAIQKNKPKYALKLDIKKFYQNIKNEILLSPEILRIKCKRTFSLLKNIIQSLPEVPLGNFTSQFFGNLILTPLDWYCKQSLKIKYYFRYCDDIIIMSNFKISLLSWKLKIKEKLKIFNLQIKENINIVELYKESLNFVGVKITQSKLKLRNKISTNFKNKRRNKNIKCIPSYFGWCQYTNSMKLFYKYVPSGNWWKIAKEVSCY
ncbi:MAG: RNA-directed DNA polymerase [Lysobacteraceae bacterium]|jgi:hypothetical protein